jgi:hypothetical protein
VLSIVVAGCSAPAAVPTTAPLTAPVANAAATAGASSPTGATLKILSPSTGGTVGLGAVKVSVNYAGPTLVPGPEAKKLDDYHLHYFLDEDANGFVQGARPIPTGNPHIIHSAAKEVTFDNVGSGSHTLAVVMSGNNHIPVNPTLIDTISFTAQ